MQVAGSIAKVATGGNLINLCFKSKVAKVASVAGYRAHVRAQNVFFTRAHQIVSRACTGGNTGNTGNFPVTMRVSEVATGGNLKQHTGNLPKEVEMEWKCGVSDDEETFATFIALADEKEVIKAMECLDSMRSKVPRMISVFDTAQRLYEKRFGSIWLPF